MAQELAQKQTAEQLAWEIYQDNCPIDWQWIRHLRRTYTSAERLNWARESVEYWAPDGVSKHFITRAANELLRLLEM
jgi:hypothetical protein